jgi:hypothetical protein
MRVVIEADERYRDVLLEMAHTIKAKIEFSEEDFWEDLPMHVKSGIAESQEEFKKGLFSSHEDVMAKYKDRYSL